MIEYYSHEYGWRSATLPSGEKVYVWRRKGLYLYHIDNKPRSPWMSLNELRKYLKNHKVEIKIKRR